MALMLWILHLENLYFPQEVNLLAAEVQRGYTLHNKHLNIKM